jgi:hypothetical protein
MPIMNCTQCQELGLDSPARCTICHINDVSVNGVPEENFTASLKQLATSKRTVLVPTVGPMFEIYAQGRKIFLGSIPQCANFLDKYAD